MKTFLAGLVLLLFSLPIFGNTPAALQTTPPPPSATAPAFKPPPTATATTTPAAEIPALPVLQAINANNLGQLQPLVTLECTEANPALSIQNLRDVVWSPVRNQLAVVHFNGVCLYDFDDPENDVVRLETSATWAGIFSPDGETLATLHNGNPGVYLWNALTGVKQATALEAGYNFPGGNTTLAYSPDGKYVATVGFNSGLRLYDAATEALLVRVRVTRQRGVYFSGDGKRLVTINDDGLSLWTVHPGPSLFLDTSLPIEDINAGNIFLRFGGEQGNILYYRSGGSLIGYDLAGDEQLEVLSTDDGIAFLPDGTLSAIYERNPYRLLSPAFANSGKLAFSSDGTFLATIPLDSNVVQLWIVPQ